MLNTIFTCALILGFAHLVRITEKPWPVIEGQPMAQQVGVCQFINLRTGVENYLEALNVLGMQPDLETGVDLLTNGAPSFGRRYDCFANVSDEEAAEIIATKEYSDIQFEIHRQMNSFMRPIKGF